MTISEEDIKKVRQEIIDNKKGLKYIRKMGIGTRISMQKCKVVKNHYIYGG